MELIISIQFLFGFAVGLPFGLVASSILHNKSIGIDKSINTLLVLVWISLHIYGFLKGIQVPLLFDIIGGGSVGHLIGFDVSELFNKFIKGKKE